MPRNSSCYWFWARSALFSVWLAYPQLAFGMALLSEQTASWVKSAQWHPVPISALLQNLSYALHADWPLIQSGIEHLVSLESGPILIGTAGLAWALVLILFDRALKKWHPTASIF
jgi:hypothetical protein